MYICIYCAVDTRVKEKETEEKKESARLEEKPRGGNCDDVMITRAKCVLAAVVALPIQPQEDPILAVSPTWALAHVLRLSPVIAARVLCSLPIIFTACSGVRKDIFCLNTSYTIRRLICIRFNVVTCRRNANPRGSALRLGLERRIKLGIHYAQPRLRR